MSKEELPVPKRRKEGEASTSNPNVKTETCDYTVLSVEDVRNLLNDQIQQGVDLLQLASEEVRWLLQNYKYNSSEMFQAYIEDSENVLKRTELSVLSDVNNQEKLAVKTMKCLICWKEFSMDLMMSAECNHFACSDCYKKYVQELIEGRSKRVKCFYLDCFYIVKNSKLQQFVPQKEIDAFQNILINDFIQNSKNIVVCYTCARILKVKSFLVTSILCICETNICVDCKREFHSPISCNMFSDWSVLTFTEDAKTIEWVTSNTKSCPKCKSPIQKAGGCMRITCHCHHQFCYLCLQQWETHDPNNCASVTNQINKSASLHENDTKFESCLKNYVTMRNESYFIDDYKMEALNEVKDEELKLILKKVFDTLKSHFLYLSHCYVRYYYEEDDSKAKILIFNFESFKNKLINLRIRATSALATETITELKLLLGGCESSFKSIQSLVKNDDDDEEDDNDE